MPQPATPIHQPGGTVAPHLRRLLEFTEPSFDDVCLDVARGPGPMPGALRPWVRHVTAVDAQPPVIREKNGRMPTVTFGTGPVRIPGESDLASTTLPMSRPPAHSDGHGAPARGGDPDGPVSPIRAVRPVPYDNTGVRRHDPDTPTIRADATALPYRSGSFTLVTTRFSLLHLGDPQRVLRELLRVCRPGGRLVIAELVRPNLAGPDRDRLERLRDPGHPGTPSIAGLTEMITSAGAGVRRLDVFTVERPAEPWLAGARDPRAADRIRAALLEEVDGGPRTGAKPRVIGGELWFTQNWAHVAAEPA
ncbi:class I SAM-dependent methyltransferase [Actinomadura miaoliensis]|uniref:Methyltransferase type 11 domain-containing protein n=1 Tax=Actinomadura miaoliensis TaxID=430685 RepID=A0ABP7W706_9ACTN